MSGKDFLKSIRQKIEKRLKRTINSVLRRVVVRFPLVRKGAEKFGRTSELIASHYPLWCRVYDTISDDDIVRIKAQMATLVYRPQFSVIIPAYQTPASYLRAVIESVINQVYQDWELCILDDASPSDQVGEIAREYAAKDARIRYQRAEKNGNISMASNLALDMATKEFVVLVDHDDLLTPDALYEFALELNAHPEADILYSDEDRMNDKNERFEPYFKTNWNPELLLSHNMVCHLGVYRRALLQKIGGFRVGYEGSQDYDLILRASLQTKADRIRHIPALLYHWRKPDNQQSFSQSQLERCIAAAHKTKSDYLQHLGQSARVEKHPLVPIWDRVVRFLPGKEPFVTLLLPLRAGGASYPSSIHKLLKGTNYNNIEVIFLDFHNEDPAFLDDLRLREGNVRFSRLAVTDDNLAAAINQAVAQAQGEIIGLLDPALEPKHPDWLREMVPLALVPEYGAIGARLLHQDGSLQHAGYVMGVKGSVAHRFAGQAAGDVGYFGLAWLNSCVSAVSGACLLVRKQGFEAVGGMDAQNFSNMYHDVDFCLKLAEKGYFNVYTPFSELRWLVSPSVDVCPPTQALNALQKRHGERLKHDPFFNPNLTIDFKYATPPRREKPFQVGE